VLKKIAIGVGGLIVLIIVIAVIAGGGGKKQTTPQPSPAVSQQTQQPEFVFDVPALVGKNIDEAKAVLGSPVDKEPTEQQLKVTKEWNLTFRKNGKELLVTYDIATKKIKDFFISTDDPSGKTQSKKHLLELGNLKEDDSRYKIEFVKALAEPAYFTGVKAIPNL
jgi:hypothetical protein